MANIATWSASVRNKTKDSKKLPTTSACVCGCMCRQLTKHGSLNPPTGNSKHEAKCGLGVTNPRAKPSTFFTAAKTAFALLKNTASKWSEKSRRKTTHQCPDRVPRARSHSFCRQLKGFISVNRGTFPFPTTYTSARVALKNTGNHTSKQAYIQMCLNISCHN